MIKTQLRLTLTTDLSNKFAGPSGFERTKFDYIFSLSITAEVAEFPPLRLHRGNTHQTSTKHRQKNIHLSISKRILSCKSMLYIDPFFQSTKSSSAKIL
jgi:hypothetical protein